MDSRADRQSAYVWIGAVLVTSAPLLFTLCAVLWQTPYPISEAVAVLEDVEIQPTSFFLDPAARSWFRPLYHLTWSAFWHGTGSLETALILFKLLEIAAVAVLILLFIWQLRPRTLIEGVAATFAVAVLVGTPGFRDNLELPLIMTTVGMPLALIVWMLLERDRRIWHGPVIVVLTLIAIGFKEQGLVIVPLVVAAWWTGAPGASRATTAAVAGMAMVYLAVRLSTSGSWPPFVQDVGFGFGRLSPAEAAARFGTFPAWMYIYNVASTVANIMFSEPTAGGFVIVGDMSRGQSTPWEINHLVSSCVLTGLVAWWGIGALKRNTGRPWSLESRVFIAAALTLAASGVLSFNYSRDRLGGMAVVFYAIAAYFAMRTAAERVIETSGPRMLAAGVALLLLAGAWQIRAIGTIEYARLTASNNHREWITNLQRRRTQFADRPVYLRIMEAMVKQGTDPSPAQPTPFPDWAAALIGGR